MSETLVNKPQRVYWHRGQYQYKASAADRKNGFKAWTPLGPDLATAIEKYDRLHRHFIEKIRRTTSPPLCSI